MTMISCVDSRSAGLSKSLMRFWWSNTSQESIKHRTKNLKTLYSFLNLKDLTIDTEILRIRTWRSPVFFWLVSVFATRFAVDCSLNISTVKNVVRVLVHLHPAPVSVLRMSVAEQQWRHDPVSCPTLDSSNLINKHILLFLISLLLLEYKLNNSCCVCLQGKQLIGFCTWWNSSSSWLTCSGSGDVSGRNQSYQTVAKGLETPSSLGQRYPWPCWPRGPAPENL